MLEPLRPGAKKNWFKGFIQSSHTLKQDDFEALKKAFEEALRVEQALLGQ
ncbi:Hypothetical protein CAP_5105 [Chondromyces apiculatus DSM 436]|uniref:Uncharacterized protein n=1 Tax=Chondromyces apiculatus DSM 436 TaxID=1192034 RepID=A0A017T5I7_9BACT|nr:Hypothetical protein CAP_5105 [Chondromyces apiculatus DSM 436]